MLSGIVLLAICYKIEADLWMYIVSGLVIYRGLVKYYNEWKMKKAISSLVDAVNNGIKLVIKDMKNDNKHD